MTGTDAAWWVDAVVYEVYLRSFADGDGDGLGDLGGLRGRLGHLAGLGVDAVWVTPFYPTPDHDHGYDVADHRDVDPRFGTLAEFDALVAAAHALGLRVLVDLVPNHTSSKHPWFVAACADPAGPRRDYYVWRPPRPDGGLPNNWRSNFGGPAWTLDPASGQYWLHLYLPEQPDLNWRNPAVHAEFHAILDFWAARGVDGFRIDVAHALVKRADLADNPPAPVSGPGVGRVSAARRLLHVNDVDQPEVLAIYRDWRARTSDRGLLLLGETVIDDPARLRPYVADQDGLHTAMWFGGLTVGFDAAAIAGVLAAGAHAGGGRLSWCLSNHDRSRPASRFGGGAAGSRRALSVAALLLAMPGPYLLFQGEELGCEDLRLDGGWQDPIAVRGNEPESGRDVARGPMPWTRAPGAGFTTGTPWLPPTPAPAAGTADEQEHDHSSPLWRWRALISTLSGLRAQLPGQVTVGRAEQTVTVDRGRLRARLNCGADPAPLDGPGRVVWRTDAGGPDRVLGAGETAWLWAGEET